MGRCLKPRPRVPVPQVKSKLEKDERWKLLPSDGERRSVFDEFCKNIAAEQKALAAAAEKQAVEGFK